MEHVRQWMHVPAIVAVETMLLPDARQLLKQQQIRRMPVVSAGGKLVGIVTEGDIYRISDSHTTDVREFNLYYRAADLPLRAFMTKPVITVTPETSMIEVATLLQQHNIGGLPVVEDERVVGMITEYDVCSCLIALEQRNA